MRATQSQSSSQDGRLYYDSTLTNSSIIGDVALVSDGGDEPTASCHDFSPLPAPVCLPSTALSVRQRHISTRHEIIQASTGRVYIYIYISRRHVCEVLSIYRISRKDSFARTCLCVCLWKEMGGRPLPQCHISSNGLCHRSLSNEIPPSSLC
ncbi:uncharacterized protein LOC122260796 [Penaeus japonicus]|uniref:uncharacterized protein LOC122260796 n=1 Tax=Penaeus japonicus TaxID=27405 RepID=UPI001C7157AB|nr:uncharacterized protein LOC122260796 [Penaeus japonicus]